MLISAVSASEKSWFFYTKMKGEIERDVIALDFPHTVILRPGVIAGHRDESRPSEAVIRSVANVVGKLNTHFLKDPWAQEAEVIAKAAVAAGVKALRDETPKGSEKVWTLGGSDIIRLGRTEWQDGKL